MLRLYHLDVTGKVPWLGGVHLTASAAWDVSLTQLPASTVAVSSGLEHRDASVNI